MKAPCAGPTLVQRKKCICALTNILPDILYCEYSGLVLFRCMYSRCTIVMVDYAQTKFITIRSRRERRDDRDDGPRWGSSGLAP